MFFSDVTGEEFRTTSGECYNRAFSNFCLVLESVRLPYYDLTSHKAAFVYPFFHAIQLLLDAARFVYGAFFLVGALATFNYTAVDNVAAGMTELLSSSILECANIALATASLATRFVALVFNSEYPSNKNGLYIPDKEVWNRGVYLCQLDRQQIPASAKQLV